MRMLKKQFLPVLPVMLLLLSGCGYHLGSIMPPQVKTIAIAPVVNDTLAYNVAAEMRGMLSEQFMVDGSLKVKSMETADCICYCKVKEVSFSEVVDHSYDKEELFRAAEWSVKVVAEVTVIIPGRKEPLLEKREVTGTSNFQVQVDMDTNRRRGIQQACRDVAQQIAQYVTEGW